MDQHKFFDKHLYIATNYMKLCDRIFLIDISKKIGTTTTQTI